ncbi:uncharacterized protein LOC124406340 [Diprion similis]|uniref:uncharacterized protein LOC124406340 n=1 Tax=Diprion similis TaxID=362088 RepID=UPI001EF95666|nr:uncharacterized protein LOC124406340 [Diprion similis]
MHLHVVFMTCAVVVAVSSHCDCDCPSFNPGWDDDYQPDFRPPTNHRPPPSTWTRTTTPTTKKPPRTTTLRPTPTTNKPVQPTVVSRFQVEGVDLTTIQQGQVNELYCLVVLDNLISKQWQEEIDRLSINDLGNFSTVAAVPVFKNLYSNPQSEWLLDEGMALNKLDKCVRNLVSMVAPKMDSEEIECLNRMYPKYLVKENRTAMLMEQFIQESSREQLPFKSFYTYREITELLFQNTNPDALDEDLRAIYEDMTDLYIKTEEDKNMKLFIIEQECEFRNARVLREVGIENARYEKFGELVKSHVDTYLVAEILQMWVPGSIIPEYRYNLWNKARSRMEKMILDKINNLKREKRDAQSLCTHAAEFAYDFYVEQKDIIFDKMPKTSLSFELEASKKYSYIVALEEVLKAKNDYRLPGVQPIVANYKAGSYCLTNFVRMIENHQRYMMAVAFVGTQLPYGYAYCNVKEMSSGLVQPRYCKCQGTFCEKFGVATVRAERFQLNLLPDNTYAVIKNSSYHYNREDLLIRTANSRIAHQKFSTWWYRHQKNPPKLNI